MTKNHPIWARALANRYGLVEHGPSCRSFNRSWSKRWAIPLQRPSRAYGSNRLLGAASEPLRRGIFVCHLGLEGRCQPVGIASTGQGAPLKTLPRSPLRPAVGIAIISVWRTTSGPPRVLASDARLAIGKIQQYFFAVPPTLALVAIHYLAAHRAIDKNPTPDLAIFWH